MSNIIKASVVSMGLVVSIGAFSNPLPYSLSGNVPTKDTSNGFNMDFSNINNSLLDGLKKSTEKKKKVEEIIALDKPKSRLNQDEKGGSKIKEPSSVSSKVEPRRAQTSVFCKNYISKSTRESLNESVVLDISSGKNIIIPISSKFLNKVETPFKNVNVLSSSKKITTLRKGVNKNILMLSSKDRKSASSMFLQDIHGNTANVTFAPCSIPPQNIKLIFDKKMIGGGDVYKDKPRKKAKKWEKNSDYVNKVAEIMALTAKGEIPEGYEYREITNESVGVACKTEGLYGKLHQIVEGANLRVGIYMVKNRGDRIININEKSCYSKDVLAVSVYPRSKLAPGEFTELFILLNKQKDVVKKNSRKMLIR